MFIKNRSSTLRLFFITAILLITIGCASQFPSPQNAQFQGKGDLNGQALFLKTFKVHGGDAINQLNDVNVGITGQWKKLITKIQPLVSDFKYRVDSQERMLVKEFAYAALYTGPSGNKKVVRTPSSVDVFYNKAPSLDPEVLSSTALTADAFFTFLLGPLALHKWKDNFIRLQDKSESGKNYHRIYLLRKSGFGFSKADEIVLWIDSETLRTAKIQITLEGHSTTKGAHVQVDYLDYVQVDNYLFPSDFYEKVNAPIAIGAHAWHLTGIDINRKLSLNDIEGAEYSGEANKPAASLK